MASSSAFINVNFVPVEAPIKEIPEYERRSGGPYWSGVSRYKATNDHTALSAVADKLKERYWSSVWMLKASIASIWSH